METGSLADLAGQLEEIIDAVPDRKGIVDCRLVFDSHDTVCRPAVRHGIQELQHIPVFLLRHAGAAGTVWNHDSRCVQLRQ